MNRSIFPLVALLASLAFAPGCGDGERPADNEPADDARQAEPVVTNGYQTERPVAGNVVETLRQLGNCDTLVTAIEITGLDGKLVGAGPMTLLAPTDQAFESLGDGVLENLLSEENTDDLAEVLRHHLFAGRLLADNLNNVTTLSNVPGEELSVRAEEGVLTVDGAEIIQADIVATNGVIHLIDRVLFPPPESPVEEALGEAAEETEEALEEAGEAIEEATDGEQADESAGDEQAPTAEPRKTGWYDAKVGDSVTYAIAGADMKQTMEVVEVGEDTVTVKVTVSAAGQEMPSRNVEMPRTTRAEAGDEDIQTRKLGAETAEIAGKSVECEVIETTVPTAKGEVVNRIWRSDRVPGGTVKMFSDASGEMTVTQEVVDFRRAE